MVFEPVAGVEELPLLVVPAPQAASSTSSKGMPIVKAKIRDQLLFMMRSASFNIIKYKSPTFTEGSTSECNPQRLATPLVRNTSNISQISPMHDEIAQICLARLTNSPHSIPKLFTQ